MFERFKRASIRPHFDIPLGGDGSAILTAIGKRLDSEDSPFIGGVLATHGYLRIPRDERSLLSPNLNLEILEENGEDTLRGRFTPHPSVWMGFMAVFLVLAMIGLGGLMISSTESLGVDSFLRLKLTVEAEEVEATGRVVWEKPADDGTFDVGVAFISIDSAHSDTLMLKMVQADTR